MRNTFFEPSYKKCGDKASPTLFYRKSKLSIFLDIYITKFYLQQPQRLQKTIALYCNFGNRFKQGYFN